jgi:hypothetical protein
MITAKKEFHRQAQEVRTPAKVLFADMEAETDGFEEVPAIPLLSPFKPSIDVNSPGLAGKEKKMAKQVRLAEDSLSAATHNLIHQRGTLLAQDKILRGLEARLDHVQDHLEVTPVGLSSDFEAPTLNGRVALLAGKFSLLEIPDFPVAVQTTEVQVLETVNKWWATHELPRCLDAFDSFNSDCESFLGSMVSSIQRQSTDIAGLASQMAKLIQESAKPLITNPTDPLSRFSSLAQGLRGVLPTATASAQSQSAAQDLPPNLVQTVQKLQLQVKDLSTKLASVSSEKANNVMFSRSSKTKCPLVILVASLMQLFFSSGSWETVVRIL